MLNAVNNRPALDFEDLLKEKANPITQSFVVAENLVKDFADVLEQSVSEHNTATQQPINQPIARKPAIEINSHEDLDKIVSSTTPERDEKGRFISNNNDAQNQSSIKKVAQTITTAIKGVMPNSPQGVDPTVDAINEVGHLLSPVRRAAGLALRPLTGLMRSKKRNEPLPREQENHNRKQIKLLQRIADNLASKGGLLGSLGKLLTSALSAGGGLLGGVLGKGKLAVYNAMKKAGFNDNWAAGLTASVGRENDYQDKYLFGKHQDKAGGTNMGMISWQGARKDRLTAYMKERGLLDSSGNIVKSQASLDAQGAFMKQEITTNPEYASVKAYMEQNPNASREDVARVLGTKYVKWAYGQTKLRNGKSFDYRPHLEKEYKYRANIDNSIQEKKPNLPKKIKQQLPKIHQLIL